MGIGCSLRGRVSGRSGIFSPKETQASDAEACGAAENPLSLRRIRAADTRFEASSLVVPRG